ncbi:MAG: hypothetical protein ABJE95_05710 [Byssovorax sp.]
MTEQPGRMDLLVQLIAAKVRPKLSDAVAQASMATIAAESATLRAAVDAARPARAKLQLLDKVLSAVARSAGIELATFKRMLKANGFSEADTHTIIPDRGQAPAKKEAAPAKKEAPVEPTAAVVPAEAKAGEEAGKGAGKS